MHAHHQDVHVRHVKALKITNHTHSVITTATAYLRIVQGKFVGRKCPDYKGYMQSMIALLYSFSKGIIVYHALMYIIPLPILCCSYSEPLLRKELVQLSVKCTLISCMHTQHNIFYLIINQNTSLILSNVIIHKWRHTCIHNRDQ